MLTFIAFALVIAGCVNWLLIGLLQYDFVAGIFGYQGSVFSRLIYIVIGAGAVFLVVKMFMDKGSIHIWGAKKKRENAMRAAHANVEAGRESHNRFHRKSKRDEAEFRDSGFREHDERYEDEFKERQEGERHSSRAPRQESLFDEHFGER